MRKMYALCAALLLSCACRKAEVPTSLATAPAAEATSNLTAAIRDARNAEGCRRMIAQEWAVGRPVPLASGRFEVFYYPMSGAPPQDPVMAEPTASAVVDAAGAPPSCRVWPGVPQDLAAPHWPAAAEALDADAFDAKSAKLDALTVAAGRAFAAGKHPSPADAALAKEYFELFDAMAELPLRRHYYRLNPAFWEWLRAAGGRSLPKA